MYIQSTGQIDQADGTITYHAMATRAGETWRASADNEYRAAYELAVALGWDFSE